MPVQIIQGDCRDVLVTMPDESVHCCVTSPPYWGLRDYGVDGQIGLEASIHEYVKGNAKTFRGGSYVNGQPGPRTEAGNVENETLSRNKRSVWTVATAPFSEAHFATFPPELIEPAIKAGCPQGGTVLDPFGGAGTTGLVADRLQRNAILIELNPTYAEMARRRICNDAPLFAEALL
jgi:DNA modification methylase